MDALVAESEVQGLELRRLTRAAAQSILAESISLKADVEQAPGVEKAKLCAHFISIQPNVSDGELFEFLVSLKA